MANSSPHDEYFKSVFSNKEYVQDFINGIFPEALRKNLHLDALNLKANSYVDDQLKTSFADLVYRCQYGSQPIEITLLIEHKSTPEQYPHLQLLRYMVNAWETQIREEKQLLPIIPIIFYHGKKAWKKQDFFYYYKQVDDNLQAFIPNFDYLLTDLSILENTQINHLFYSFYVRMGFQILKNIHNEEKVKTQLEIISKSADEIIQNQKGKTFFETTLAYILRSTKLDTETIKNIIEKYSRKGGDIVMTTAEKLEKKGMEQGMEQGKKEGINQTAIKMIEKGADDEFIRECTGLTQEDIDKLRKESTNN